MVPLIATILLSAAGQLGFKLAMGVGQKLFASTAGGEKADGAQSFAAQLRKHMEGAGPGTSAAPMATALTPGAPIQFAGSSAASATATEAADAYRRAQTMSPAQTVSPGLISPYQAP